MNEQRLDKYVQNVIFDLLAAVRIADLTRPESAAVLLAKIDDILDQYGRTLSDVVPEQIVLDYFGGVDEANKALAAAGASVGTAKAIQNGTIRPEFRGLIHLEAVEEIIDDAMGDIAQAIAATRRASEAAVLQMVEDVRADLAAGLIRGDAQDATVGRVMNTFLAQGMTAFVVEDKNGIIRRLPLHFYARTVVRTKTRDAQVKGSLNRYKDVGQQFVRIVGNGDSCAQCSQYRDLVVSLGNPVAGVTIYTEGDIPMPPYHPNCRCGIITFDLATASKEELEAMQTAFDEYAPGKDRRTPAEKAAYEKEQAGRRVANENLKQYQRWQNALGAEAPKTFGAFQNMKRQNTVKFQQLQSEYRSFAQLNRKP